MIFSSKHPSTIGVLGLGMALILSLSACKPRAGMQSMGGPAPEVTVSPAKSQDFPLEIELPGRVSAFLISEVRARVDGIVLSRDFEEGSKVKAGQLLYQVDPAFFKAQLDSAKAALSKAQASLMGSTVKLRRYRQLVATQAISRQDYDNAVVEEAQAKAEVAARRAQLNSAEINLGYTTIRAPISGRIGRAYVTRGAYVQAGQATLLAKIQRIDPVYVDVAQASADLIRLRRLLATPSTRSSGAKKVAVELVLEDGLIYSLPGQLEFSDISIDTHTGSLALRARFPNPNHELLPGMYVRARIREAIQHTVVLPQTSVNYDPTGRASVLVVDQERRVVQKNLQVRPGANGMLAVTSGLQEGEQVIVSGAQKARPGMVVRVRADSAGLNPPPPQAVSLSAKNGQSEPAAAPAAATSQRPKPKKENVVPRTATPTVAAAKSPAASSAPHVSVESQAGQ